MSQANYHSTSQAHTTAESKQLFNYTFIYFRKKQRAQQSLLTCCSVQNNEDKQSKL